MFLVNSLLTLRTYFQDYIKDNNISLNHFSELANMNVGTLSNLIHGKRPIAVQQLDQITIAMGLEEGYFYERYVTECFEQETPDWRRLGPLLRRCAELNKLNCVEEILKHMLDNLGYISLLFEMAEQFFSKGKNEAAILLYEYISESERAQHSERLALCQYRLFTLKLSDDQENNLIVATCFEPYVERLDEAYQLDAINELLNINMSLRRWKKVEQNATKLLNKSTKEYELFGRGREKRFTVKPLVYYILYSYLVYADVYYQLGQYDKALKYVNMYADAPWVIDPNKEELVVLEQFHEWAEANCYMYQLMAGQVEVLDDYVEYIALRESEIFLGVYSIVTAANKHLLNIDSILERFKDYLELKEQKNVITKINDHVTIDRYTDFTGELAIYYLKNNKSDSGIFFLLESLASAIKINNENAMVKAMGLYEHYRHLVSTTEQCKYNKLIREVLKVNEIKMG